MTAARRRPSLSATAALAVLATGAALTAVAPAAASSVASPPGNTVRFATFNASLNRAAAGQLVSDLSTSGNAQAANVAEVVQRERPDVLLINEFDYDAAGQALALFQDNYLSVAHNGAAPIDYPYAYTAPSNTGIASGFDLNNNGTVVTTPGAFGYGDDALGFGAFPGQFGMAVYSKYPIDLDAVRTFQNFKWKDMPGARLPDVASTPAAADWYSPAELAVLPLSSKSHWDLPLAIGKRTVHFLVSHPTPPVFDGPEDRNGRRNFDEIRLWADYVTPGAGSYIYDDAGTHGGLAPGESFVIAGDQNSDPLDGDSIPGSIQQLLDNPGINTTNTPESAGAPEASALQGGANLTHRSDPRFDTADFSDFAPGNLRADYVLPSSDLSIWDSGVFWPVQADPLFRLTGVFTPSLPGGFPTSDHRSVWVDVKVPGASSPSR
jgi:3-phytase